jgi:hypothetical protein
VSGGCAICMGQGAVSVNRYRSQRNWGLAFSSTTRGTRAVFLENELLRVGVLAGNGTDVFEFNDKPHDMDFVWLTAGGMRNPASYLSTSPDLLRQPRLQGVGAGDLSFQPRWLGLALVRGAGKLRERAGALTGRRLPLRGRDLRPRHLPHPHSRGRLRRAARGGRQTPSGAAGRAGL